MSEVERYSMPSTAADFWSITSGIVSVVLGGLSIWLALYLYDKTKSTEGQVTNSLAKIEAQTETLARLSGKWMDRLTRYVTDDRPRPLDDSAPQLLALIAQLPQSIASQLSQPSRDSPQEALLAELINTYITIYFYTAQTNYWSQLNLPDAAEFDSKNEFHKLTKRIVDSSAADFQIIARILGSVDQRKIAASELCSLVDETKGFWKDEVRTSSDVFVSRAKFEQS